MDPSVSPTTKTVTVFNLGRIGATRCVEGRAGQRPLVHQTPSCARTPHDLVGFLDAVIADASDILADVARRRKVETPWCGQCSHGEHLQPLRMRTNARPSTAFIVPSWISSTWQTKRRIMAAHKIPLGFGRESVAAMVLGFGA